MHELHKIMSCQKEKFNFIDGVDEKGEPARDCRRGCSHTLQEVPFFFSLGTVESEIRARGNGYPMRGR